MNTFAIGEVVQVTGPTMTGDVGIVVSIDERREKVLVWFTEYTQSYFAPRDLTAFTTG